MKHPEDYTPTEMELIHTLLTVLTVGVQEMKEQLLAGKTSAEITIRHQRTGVLLLVVANALIKALDADMSDVVGLGMAAGPALHMLEEMLGVSATWNADDLSDFMAGFDPGQHKN